MLAVLKTNTPKEQAEFLINWLKEQGLGVHVSSGDYRMVYLPVVVDPSHPTGKED